MLGDVQDALRSTASSAKDAAKAVSPGVETFLKNARDAAKDLFEKKE
jgi:ElaB/YqjD/DUF883 family membrane-anchored ribosome-binding protein